VKIGTREYVRGSFDLDGDLIVPADEDGSPGVALDVEVFPRPLNRCLILTGSVEPNQSPTDDVPLAIGR
jgi:hypothetical protein